MPLRSAAPFMLPPAQKAPLPVRTTPHTPGSRAASASTGVISLHSSGPSELRWAGQSRVTTAALPRRSSVTPTPTPFVREPAAGTSRPRSVPIYEPILKNGVCDFYCTLAESDAPTFLYVNKKEFRMTSDAALDRYARYTCLKFDRPHPRVMRVVFNSPLKLGAMTAAMHREISEVWRDLEQDNSVNAIIVTGDGRSFSSGGDL